MFILYKFGHGRTLSSITLSPGSNYNVGWKKSRESRGESNCVRDESVGSAQPRPYLRAFYREVRL